MKWSLSANQDQIPTKKPKKKPLQSNTECERHNLSTDILLKIIFFKYVYQSSPGKWERENWMA